MQNPTWYNHQVHGCCNIAVQSCYFLIPWQHVLSCMKMAVDLSWRSQQRSGMFVHQALNSLFQHAWTSLSTTIFKLASWTTFKPVNNHVQAGQLNHEQACQQPCSSWPAQPCSSLSTTMFKLASLTMFKPVNNHVKACQQAKTSCAFLRV